jgi:hypothetical protein
MRTAFKYLTAFLFAGSIFSLLTPRLVSAQEFRASVTGIVTDPAGAVVVNAGVKVLNKGTNVAYPSKTNGAGVYSIDLLPVGEYSISVTAPGFAAADQNFTLHGGDRLQIDLKLHPGQESQVIVSANDAPLLQTSRADAGMTLGSYDVHDLPLLGRNPFALAEDVPGVTLPPGQAPSTSLRPFDNGGMDSFQVNGSQRFSTNYLIDGASDVVVDNTGPANLGFVPSPDMTQEFRMQTLVFDAQYGRSGGGIISVNMKSGTNDFHAVGYDYVRNAVFNANSYSNKKAGVRRSNFNWEEPGFEIDGPVRIPKVFNGRDKLFFLFGWEAIHTKTPSPAYLTLPNSYERSGDFSHTAVYANCTNVTAAQCAMTPTIYDPATSLPNGSGGFVPRTAFMNGMIPNSRINSVASTVLPFIPLPNLNITNADGLLVDSNDDYASPNTADDDYNSFAYKVDYVVSPKHRLSFEFDYNHRLQVLGTSGFAAVASPNYINPRINHAAHVDWSWVISPTLVSSLRMGWVEHNFGLENRVANFDPTTIGFPASEVSASPAPTLFPYFNINGYQAFGNAGHGVGLINNSDTFSLREMLIKLVGKHQFSFGGEFQPMRDSRANSSPDVRFYFDSTFTQLNPATAVTGQGNAFADYLLGLLSCPNSATTSCSYAINGPRPAYTDDYMGAFFQDNWRVNDRTTLTLGLRWDTETPELEKHNKQDVGFNPTQSYTQGGLPLVGQVQFATGTTRGAYNADLNNFGPRVGLAYRATEKTVIKTGFGILYAPTFDTPTNLGYASQTYVDFSDNGGYTPNATLSNPFPTGFIQPSSSAADLIGQASFTAWQNHTRQVPKTAQYTLGIEREIPFHTLFSIRYVGQHATNLPISRSPNFLPRSLLPVETLTPSAATNAAQAAQVAYLNATVVNPFKGLAPGTTFNNATLTRYQSLLPFPQYGSFTVIQNTGLSDYQGLQVGIFTQAYHGLNLRTSYSFSKNLQTVYLNQQDTSTRENLTPQDIRHNLTISGGYIFPFFLNRSNGFVKEALGGWQLNSVYIYSSGMLFAAPGAVIPTGSSVATAHPTASHQFNTCTLLLTGVRQNCSIDTTPAWVVAPTYGLAIAPTYYGGLRVNIPQLVNASIFKKWSLHDRIYLQFRAEAFNLTNTPQFRAPDTGYNSATFGQLTNFVQINDFRQAQLALRLGF